MTGAIDRKTLSRVLQNADFDAFRALWKLKLLAIDYLSLAGVKALELGIDTPASRMLAGLENADLRDKAPVLFEEILEQHGLPSEEEAAMTFARSVADAILRGTIGAGNGARAIWAAAEKVNKSIEFHELDGFIYAASEYEDRPKDEAFFVAAIERESRNLLLRLAK